MDQSPVTSHPVADATRRPLAHALLLGTSFVGITWLLEPLFARIGLKSDDFSRPHILFVAAVYGLLMTIYARRRALS